MTNLAQIDIGKNTRRPQKIESTHWWDMQHSLVLRQTPRWAQSLAMGLGTLGIGGIIACFTINIDEVITAQGRLVAKEGSIEIKSPVGGMISMVNFSEGDLVEKGDTIAVFDRRRLEEEMRNIDEQIKQSKINSNAILNSLKKRKEAIIRNYNTNKLKLNKMEEIFELGALSANAIYEQRDRVLDLKANYEEIDQQITSNRSQFDEKISRLLANKASTTVQLQYVTVKSPKKGILFNLAYFMAAILPSVPLFPNPPGINTPDILLSNGSTFLGSKCSESILSNFTLTLFEIPPCIKASSKDLYASLRLIYFPIIPILTSFFGFKTFEVIFFHFERSGFFLFLILKKERTLSSKFSL